MAVRREGKDARTVYRRRSGSSIPIWPGSSYQLETGAPTRSGCTSPPSGIRWWATGRTAAPARDPRRPALPPRGPARVRRPGRRGGDGVHLAPAPRTGRSAPTVPPSLSAPGTGSAGGRRRQAGREAFDAAGVPPAGAPDRARGHPRKRPAKRCPSPRQGSEKRWTGRPGGDGVKAGRRSAEVVHRSSVTGSTIRPLIVISICMVPTLSPQT